MKSHGQARAFWQWCNYVRRECPENLTPLYINLDETSVAQFYPYQRGNIMSSGSHNQEHVQRISRGRIRGSLTHIGLITDRADIQPLLPQILLSNGHVITKRDAVAAATWLPKNIKIWREKSSWTNWRIIIRVLREVRLALAALLDQYKVIFFMDCARQHLNYRVAMAAARNGFYLVYVPASLTWLLQPCDTHVFAKYKRCLSALLGQVRAASPDATVCGQDWLRCVAVTIRKVMQGHVWRSAFDADGLTGTQAHVSSFVRRMLGPSVDELVPATRPTEHQIQTCFPRQTKAPVASLLRPFRPGAVFAMPALDDVAGDVVDDAAAVPVKRWALRRRPERVPPLILRRWPKAKAAMALPPPPPPRPPAPRAPVAPKASATKAAMKAAPVAPSPAAPPARRRKLTISMDPG